MEPNLRILYNWPAYELIPRSDLESDEILHSPEDKADKSVQRSLEPVYSASDLNRRKRKRDCDSLVPMASKDHPPATLGVDAESQRVVNTILKDINQVTPLSNSKRLTIPLENSDEASSIPSRGIVSPTSEPDCTQSAISFTAASSVASTKVPMVATSAHIISNDRAVLVRFCHFLQKAIINTYPNGYEMKSQLKLHHDHPLLVGTTGGENAATIIDSPTFKNWGSFILLTSIVSHYTERLSTYCKHHQRSFFSSLVFSIAAGTLSDHQDEGDVALAVDAVLDPRYLASSTPSSNLAGSACSMTLGEYFQRINHHYASTQKIRYHAKQIFLVITCIEALLMDCYNMNDTITKFPDDDCYNTMRHRLVYLADKLLSIEQSNRVYTFNEICKKAIENAWSNYYFILGSNRDRILTQSITIMSRETFQPLFNLSNVEYEILLGIVKTRRQQSSLASKTMINKIESDDDYEDQYLGCSFIEELMQVRLMLRPAVQMCP